MRYFPIFLDLENRKVLVVGCGEEGVRKIRLLLKTSARIEVVASVPPAELAETSGIIWHRQGFSPALLAEAALVYVADESLAKTVSLAARAVGVPVNVIDDAESSSFLTPSLVDRDPVVIAIGTEGAAPVLAQSLRARIEALLPQKLGELAVQAKSLRPLVAKLIPTGRTRRLFWSHFFFGAQIDKPDNFPKLLSACATALPGRISLIDASSDDGELLTLKAQRHLMEADLLLHADDLNPIYFELARRDGVRESFKSHSDISPLIPRLKTFIQEGLHVIILSSCHADYSQFLNHTQLKDLGLEVLATVHPVQSMGGENNMQSICTKTNKVAIVNIAQAADGKLKSLHRSSLLFYRIFSLVCGSHLIVRCFNRSRLMRRLKRAFSPIFSTQNRPLVTLSDMRQE